MVIVTCIEDNDTIQAECISLDQFMAIILWNKRRDKWLLLYVIKKVKRQLNNFLGDALNIKFFHTFSELV